MSKNKKEKSLLLKEELESLLNETDNNDTTSINNSNPQDLKQTLSEIAEETEKEIDFEEIDNTNKKEAETVISSLFGFYINENIINKDDYFEVRKKYDSDILSELNFQEKILKLSIQKLTNELVISVHPRLAEVLSGLIAQKNAVTHAKFNLITVLTNSYKSLKTDVQVKESENNDITFLPDKEAKKIEDTSEITEIKKDEYYVGVGTRNLIKQINEEIPIEKIKEANKDKETYNLTDPNGKSNLMKKLNISDEMIRTNTTKDDINKNDIDLSDIENII